MEYKSDTSFSIKKFNEENFKIDNLSLEEADYIKTIENDFLYYLDEIYTKAVNEDYSYEDIMDFLNIIDKISPDYIKEINDSNLIDKTMSILNKFLFHSIHNLEEVYGDIEVVKNMLLFVKRLSKNLSNKLSEQEEEISNHYYDTLIPDFLKNCGASFIPADPDKKETFDKNLELSLDIYESNSISEGEIESVIENNIIKPIRQKISSDGNDYANNILESIERVMYSRTYSIAREQIIYNLFHLYFINELSYGKDKDPKERSADMNYLTEAFRKLNKNEYIGRVFGLYKKEKVKRPRLQTLDAFDRILEPIIQSSLQLDFKSTFLLQIIKYTFVTKEKINDSDTIYKKVDLFVHISSIIKKYNLRISNDEQDILTDFANLILDELIKNPKNDLFNMQTHENKEKILDIISEMTKYADSQLSLLKIIKSQILEELIDSDHTEIMEQSYEIISLCLLSINTLPEAKKYNGIFKKLLLTLSREKNLIISDENEVKDEERLFSEISETIKDNIDNNGNVINPENLLESLKTLSDGIEEIQNSYDTEELNKLLRAGNFQVIHKKEDSDNMEKKLFDSAKPVNPITIATKALNISTQISSLIKMTHLKSGEYIDKRAISIKKDEKSYLLYNGGQQKIGKNRTIEDHEEGESNLKKVGIDFSSSESEENDDEMRFTGKKSKKEIKENTGNSLDNSSDSTVDFDDFASPRKKEGKTHEEDSKLVPSNDVSEIKTLEGNSLKILIEIVWQKNCNILKNGFIYKKIDGKYCYNFIFDPLDNAMQDCSIKIPVRSFTTLGNIMQNFSTEDSEEDFTPSVNMMQGCSIKDPVEVFLQQKIDENMISEITSGKDFRIFIPCNIGNHWVLEEVLIRYEGEDKFGFYSSIYDSFNPNNFLNKENLNCFEAFKTSFPNMTIEERGEITDQNRIQVRPKICLQNDSYSCGYFSLFFLEKRLNGKILSDIERVNIEEFIQDKMSKLKDIGMFEDFKKSLNELSRDGESWAIGYLSGQQNTVKSLGITF